MINKKSTYCDIYFVRHGETDWNAEQRLQGHSDIPLNENGLAQALALRETLSSIPFVAAFSSDLSRAAKTAELIIESRSISLKTSPALRERSAGCFEGKPVKELETWMDARSEIVHKLPKEEFVSYQWHPDMETAAAVYQRATQFLCKQVSSFIGLPILVVSHGGVLRAILDHLDFLPRHRWIVQNCSYLHLKANDSEFKLEYYKGITRKEIGAIAY